MTNELSDKQIIELASLNDIRMRTGGGAIKLARAVIAADRAQRQGDVPAGELSNSIMSQAQVFASAWALVGGRFDTEHGMVDAEDAKKELASVVQAALAAKDEEIAALTTERDALRNEIFNARKLIVDVYGMLPQREQARETIERRTGHWFAFGADRTA